MNSTSTSSSHRPEIDGLRALAVIGVLLFHFDLGFPGGFVGVDVFFVISGYLITGILLRDLRAGTFSLSDFWVRRIRRILPASFVMAVTTVVLGFTILSPLAYKRLIDTAIAQALMVSNFVFAQQADYFVDSTESSPLLHTWSLAVEEQFYIIFPLLLWLIWRLLGKRWLPTALATAALGSLAWSCHLLPLNPMSTFFLLPSRAWELLAGAMLALLAARRVGTKTSEALSGAGLTMIVISMFAYNKLTPFPSAMALLPVVGASLFIFGNQGNLTFTGRLLAWKPIMFIGLISYSLYLWHWPLLIFSKYITLELTHTHKFSLLLISLILATLSWRFIETPFRRRRSTSRLHSKLFTFAAAGLSVSLMVGLPFCLKAGITNPVDEDIQLLLEDVDWHGNEYTPPDISGVATLRTTPIGARDGELDFMLWGDSHAMAISQTVDKIAKQHGARGEAIYTVAVQPVTGVFFQELTEPEREDMLKRNEAIVARLIDKKIPNVILVGRWVACCVGFNKAEMVGCKPMFRLAPMLVDEVGTSPSNKTSTAVLARQLAGMCKRLQAAGTKVWIMRQVPETIHLNTAQLVATFKRFPVGNKLSQFTTIRAEHDERRALPNTVFTNLEAVVLDPSDRFFAEGNRLKIYAERSYYRDDDHLTRAGADHYLSPMFDRVFKQITTKDSN